MRVRRICSASLVLAVLAGATLSAQDTQDTPDTPAALYESACAACHGADGRGLPTSVLGFETPVPDFTDCSFATPEADADWFAVAHQGGPVRAFDRRMPAFGEALQEAQLQRILDHIRTFCDDPRWPRGELNLPRALVTEKAFPENETVLTTTIAGSGPGRVVNALLYEQRLGARTQFEVVAPFVSHDTGTGWRSGLGDVAVAVKRVLAHSLNTGSILSVAAEGVFPTGKQSEGLGSGVTVFEPFVSFGQILPIDAFLQAQAGVELPDEGAREAFWRLALGKTLVERRFGRAWSPMVELLAAREWEDAAVTRWDVVPQFQVSLSKRQHILINIGVRVPINDRVRRPSQVMTYFLWDWFDGGLLDGWR